MGLRSKIIRTDLIDWKRLSFLQEETFKQLPSAEREKLRNSLLRHEFTQPFYVWEDEAGTRYCLDGFHRCRELAVLVNEGIEVPELLPATFIECDNRQEAARLVLQYSSIYAKVTEAGMVDFLEAFELNFADIEMSVDLPDFSMETYLARTEQDFSGQNEELDLDSFTDEITLKLVYPKAEYLQIKTRLNQVMVARSINKAEELIKDLVYNAV